MLLYNIKALMDEKVSPFIIIENANCKQFKGDIWDFCSSSFLLSFAFRAFFKFFSCAIFRDDFRGITP